MGDMGYGWTGTEPSENRLKISEVRGWTSLDEVEEDPLGLGNKSRGTQILGTCPRPFFL